MTLPATFMIDSPGDAARAVEAAVYLHGLACDMAVRKLDEHTLLATDCLRHLARAFRFRGAEFDSFDREMPMSTTGFQLGRENGYVWLQGLPRGGRHGRFEDFRND